MDIKFVYPYLVCSSYAINVNHLDVLKSQVYLQSKKTCQSLLTPIKAANLKTEEMYFSKMIL